MMDLSSVQIKQQAWHLQIKDEISKNKRPIDKLSIAEIRKMYQERKFLCDSCGNELGKCEYTLEEHITHLINPSYYWCCEDCLQNDLRSNRIIAISEEPKPENWQIENR